MTIKVKQDIDQNYLALILPAMQTIKTTIYPNPPHTNQMLAQPTQLEHDKLNPIGWA